MGIMDMLTGAVPSKPRPSEKRSTASSRASDAARNAMPRAPSSPVPSPLSSGVTKAQGDQIRAAQQRLHQNAEAAARESTEAADMLRKMTTPGEKEGPTQLQELIDAIARIAESQARIEAKIDRIEGRRSATVVPLRG